MKTKKINNIDILSLMIILFTVLVTVAGLLSFDISKSYDIVNQYGDTIKMFGSGIYAHDSYFKVPITIGSDFTILVMVVPMLIIALIREIKSRTNKTKMCLISVLSAVLYYATGLVFGVTYNSFHLIYITLFACTLFAVFSLIRNIDIKQIREAQQWKLPSKGLSIFLILSGIAIIIAWLPDILSSLIAGTSLSLIEVYTTEITYVLDMGIVGPLCLVCLYLLKKKDGLGDILLTILLKLCLIIGVMMIPQTVYQIISGPSIQWVGILAKSGSFVALGGFAAYFDSKLYRGLK